MSLQTARRASRLSGALQHMWAAASLETSASAAAPSGQGAPLCTAPNPTAAEARSQFAAAGTSVRAGAAPQQQQQPQRWRHTLLPRPLGPQGHSAPPRRGWASAAAQAAPAEPPAQQREEAASPSSAAYAGASEGLQVSERAAQRLRELAAAGGGAPLVLRLSVEGGGCSGFQYEFALAAEPQPGDR